MKIVLAELVVFIIILLFGSPDEFYFLDLS